MCVFVCVGGGGWGGYCFCVVLCSLFCIVLLKSGQRTKGSAVA